MIKNYNYNQNTIIYIKSVKQVSRYETFRQIYNLLGYFS